MWKKHVKHSNQRLEKDNKEIPDNREDSNKDKGEIAREYLQFTITKIEKSSDTKRWCF